MSPRRTAVLLHVAEIRTRADGSVVLVLEGGDRITISRVRRGEDAGVLSSWLAYAACPLPADAGDAVVTAREIAERRRAARAGMGWGLKDQATIAF